MKLIKTSAIFAFFCILWIIPLINRNTEKHIWIFITGFILSALCLMFIKNAVLSFLTAFISAFIPVAFHFDILFLILPSITVIFYFAHLQNKAVILKNTSADRNKNKIKPKTVSHTPAKKTTPAVYTGAVLSFIVSTCICIYLFFKKFPKQDLSFNNEYKLTYMIVFGLFFVFGALAVISISKKTTDKQTAHNKVFTDNTLISLKSLYISSFFCFIQSIFNFCLLKNDFTAGYERAFFFPWFIYFFLITYYEDPVFCTLIRKGKSAFENFSEKHYA